MRLGIFGGTFDPIHFGHLRSAEEVRQAHGLDRVLFVPSARPPHKRHRGVAAGVHRAAMARLAIRGNPAFRFSSIELDRRGNSYSVDTLRALREEHPRARFSFIMGLDAFREIHTWRDYRALFGLCDIVVTSRPPGETQPLRALLPVAAQAEFCYQPEANVLVHSSGNRVAFQALTDLSISATEIRAHVARGRSIRYLVPAAVERYIAEHGLYLSSTRTSRA